MAFSLIKDIDNFFTKFFAKTTSAQKVLATVGALAPLIEAGLTVEDPAAAPVVTAAFTEVQTDLGTFQSIVKQSGTTPTALNVLNAINSNLTGLLQDAQVKNSAKSAEITAKVNAVVSEVNAIAAFFPARPGLSVLPEARTLARGRRDQPRGSPAAFPSPRQARGLTYSVQGRFQKATSWSRFLHEVAGEMRFPYVVL